MKIEYVEFDPFNVASVDPKTETIYIDIGLKGTPEEKLLIEHEKMHLKLKSWFFEPPDFGLFFKLLKYKPLLIFQFLIPISIAKKGKDLIFFIDPLGLISWIIFIVGFTLIFSYKRVICTFNGCKVCNIFGCKPL